MFSIYSNLNLNSKLFIGLPKSTGFTNVQNYTHYVFAKILQGRFIATVSIILYDLIANNISREIWLKHVYQQSFG